jgi:DNA-binding HxlR family transcriptional regulator
MLGVTYERENCSAARALEIVGERWSLLIIREALFARSTRFSQFQRNLGLAPNTLSSRLDRFLETGIMRTQPVPDHHETREYVLTHKGLDLLPVVVALTKWGDRWAAPAGPPIIYKHAGCGGQVHQLLRCENCGAELAPTQVTTGTGPGSLPGELGSQSTTGPG